MLNFAPQENTRERARSYACLKRCSNNTLLIQTNIKQTCKKQTDKKQVISDKTSDSGQHKADKQKNEKIIVEV